MTSHDFLAALKYLLQVKQGNGVLDDIDHLGSRRVRAVGELLANQCRLGLARTERLVKERMTLFDVNLEGMSPQKLVNPKALSAVVRDFFGRSQLSQFMDQTNPLSELTHKRRLSALGPGGLNRDRAGFEVRDVHPSHYGRICPIETPEGPNIGLINSMSCFARINEFGFIETPYRCIENGKVIDKIEYLTADQEENYCIAQANNPIEEDGCVRQFDASRCVSAVSSWICDPKECHYMDVSPKQLVSVAASLIPFLEHDDANRALMGSNMQRQGVPLACSQMRLSSAPAWKPRRRVIHERWSCLSLTESLLLPLLSAWSCLRTVNCQSQTLSSSLDPSTLKSDPSKGLYVYPFRKFMRSNAGTCMNQKPLVKRGDKVKKGHVLADGPCTETGELASVVTCSSRSCHGTATTLRTPSRSQSAW